MIGLNETYRHGARLAAEAGYPYMSTRLDLISRYPLLDPAGGRRALRVHRTRAGSGRRDRERPPAVGGLRAAPDPRRLGSQEGPADRTRDTPARDPPGRPGRCAPVAEAGIPSFIDRGLQRAVAPGLDRRHRGTAAADPLSRPMAGEPLLLERQGFVDTYHAVHPDPVADQGLTWPSGRPRSPDSWNPRRDAPQDRIDQVWVAGDGEHRPRARSWANVEVPRCRHRGQAVGIGSPRGRLDDRSGAGDAHRSPSAVDPRLVDQGNDVTVTYHAPGAIRGARRDRAGRRRPRHRRTRRPGRPRRGSPSTGR